MPSEIGSATFGLVVGMGRFKRGLAEAEDEAGKAGRKVSDGFDEAGDKAGRRFARGVADGIEDVGPAMESAGGTAADGFASGFDIEWVADAGQELVEKMGSKIGPAAAGVGVAAAGALAMGLFNGMETEVATDRLVAQLGGSDWAQDIGRIAGELYTQGFGESIESVNAAVRGVVENILPEGAPAEVEALTAKLLTFSDVMEQDVGETTQAVGQLIRTGLARDGAHALDLLTRGIQQGGNQFGDFVGSVAEGAGTLAQFGLSGEQAINATLQALDAGARSGDFFVGILEELAGNAGDSADIFDELGLNGEEMARKLTAGGPEAAGALQELFDALRGIEDPAKRAVAATQLFGEEGVANMQAILAIDLSPAASQLGRIEGATDRLASAYDNNKSRIETWRREGMERLTNFVGGEVIPALERLGKWFGRSETRLTALKVVAGGVAAAVAAHFTLMGTKAVWASLKTVGSVGKMIGSWALMGARAAATTARVVAGWVAMAARGMWSAGQAVVAAGRVVASWALMGARAAAHGAVVVAPLALQGAKWAWLGIQAMLGAAKVAAAWLLSMWPIALIIAAVVGLVALIVIHFDTIKSAIGAAWKWITDKASQALNWLRTNWPTVLAIITGPIGLAVLAVSKNWDRIKGGATAVKNWIRDRFNDVVNFVRGLGGRISSAASGMWRGITSSFKTAVNAVIGLWNGIRLGPWTIGGWDPLGSFGPSIPEFTIDLRSPNLPYLAEGGLVSRRGAGIVGEAGPELLELPTGARVTPLDRIGADATRAHGGMEVIQLVLDGRVVTEVVRDRLDDIDRRNGRRRGRSLAGVT